VVSLAGGDYTGIAISGPAVIRLDVRRQSPTCRDCMMAHLTYWATPHDADSDDRCVVCGLVVK